MTRKFAAGAVLAALLPSLALFEACSPGTEDGAELVLSSKGFLWSIGHVR